MLEEKEESEELESEEWMRINFTAFLLRCCCGNRIYLDGAEEKGKSMGISFLCVQYCMFVLTTDEIIVARWESIACMGYYCVILHFLLFFDVFFLIISRAKNKCSFYLFVCCCCLHSLCCASSMNDYATYNDCWYIIILVPYIYN